MGFWDRLLWEIGFAICHQRADRLLRFGDRPLFVCARDTGIFVSFLALLLALAFPRGERRAGMPSLPVLLICLAGVSFLAWDGLSAYLGWRETTNLLRFLSGAAGGAGLAVPVAALVNREVWYGDVKLRILSGSRDRLLAVAALLGTLPVYLLRPGFLFRAAQAWLLFSVLGTFFYLNLLLVCVLRPAEGRERSWRRHAVAFLLLALELAASHALHRVLAGVGPATGAMAEFHSSSW